MIVPFEPEHLKAIKLQAEQSLFQKELQSDYYARSLADYGGWTLLDGERVLACAGLIMMWPGRYGAWAVISRMIGAAGMVVLTRAARRGLDLQTGRVEAIVADGFAAGHRWAELLGFTKDTPEAMKSWLPDGSAAFMYSRVK